MIVKVSIPVPIVDDHQIFQETDHANTHTWNNDHTKKEDIGNGPKIGENSTQNEGDTQWNRVSTVEIPISLVRVS